MRSLRLLSKPKATAFRKTFEDLNTKFHIESRDAEDSTKVPNSLLSATCVGAWTCDICSSRVNDCNLACPSCKRPRTHRRNHDVASAIQNSKSPPANDTPFEAQADSCEARDVAVAASPSGLCNGSLEATPSVTDDLLQKMAALQV